MSLSQCFFTWFLDKHFRNPGHHPTVGAYFLCELPARRRRTTMNKRDPISWKKLEHKWVSRRNLTRGAAGVALGTGLLRPNPAYANHEDDDRGGAKALASSQFPAAARLSTPSGLSSTITR
jgi:hypothetical protein